MDRCGPPLNRSVLDRRATLLYSAKETGHNNAVALKEYIHIRLSRPARG